MKIVLKLPGHKAVKASLSASEISTLFEYQSESCMNTTRDNKAQPTKAWCHGNGNALGLPFNLARPTDGALIRGPIVFTGMHETEEGPDWCDLETHEADEIVALCGVLGLVTDTMIEGYGWPS